MEVNAEINVACYANKEAARREPAEGLSSICGRSKNGAAALCMSLLSF